MKFKDNLADYLDKILKHSGASLAKRPTSEIIAMQKSEMEELIKAAFSAGANSSSKAGHGETAEEFVARIKGAVFYSQMVGRVEQLHVFAKAIADQKSVLSKADYSERNRYIAYRFLTAVAIAIVILGTGFAAKVLEIPLPLLRVTS